MNFQYDTETNETSKTSTKVSYCLICNLLQCTIKMVSDQDNVHVTSEDILSGKGQMLNLLAKMTLGFVA